MLPAWVDSESIQAHYTDGVLKISIPKREEAKVEPTRQIEIGYWLIMLTRREGPQVRRLRAF